ncbi:MAG: hypothetical protein C0467_00535 [Planctomycetaceae bacterium]|nr:hypothetical protein [Planctomycetaceae bacterium]
MMSLTRTITGTVFLALLGAAFLGLQGSRPAAADEPEPKVPATKATQFDHTAFGAVIKANSNRVPASGSELVQALQKLGDFAQLPVPFSAVNTSSGLTTPRVIIAPRPGTTLPDPNQDPSTPKKDDAPVKPARGAKIGGLDPFAGFGGFPAFRGVKGVVNLGGQGLNMGIARDIPVPPISPVKATEPSLEGRLFLAANMEMTNDGQFRVKTIEVISWNSRKKRFDFGVIECGVQPAEFQVLDGVRCFSCHKNKGPILGQGPWSNSTHNDVVRAAALQAFDIPGLNGKPLPKPVDPDAGIPLNANAAMTEPPGGWSNGLRSNPSLAQIKEATTFDGISLVIPEPEACDAAVRQGAELARDRDVYRAMTKSPDGRRALTVLLTAIANPMPIEQSNTQAKRDLDMTFTANFPTFADELVAIHKASVNTLGDYSPSGSIGNLRSVTTNTPAGWGGGSSQRTDILLVWGGNSKAVMNYDEKRASGDAGMPSQRQPSNPRAFLRPAARVPAKPSTAVSAMGLARTIGLTEGDREFLGTTLTNLAQQVNKPKVTVATLAKEVFTTSHFTEVIKANDIPDREEFKDRFAAAVNDVAAGHRLSDTIKFSRTDYASGPSVALPPGQEEKEVAVVPTTACLRCHDVTGTAKQAFNPIPMLAFDPFDKPSRENWVRNNEAKKRELVIGRMLKRLVADKDMPPEDAPEYERFRTKDQPAFDGLKDWLEAEMKRAKGN